MVRTKHVSWNESNALYIQGYTPSICDASMRSVEEGKVNANGSNACLINVYIAATLGSQKTSVICASAPLLLRPAIMASCCGPSQRVEDDKIIRERMVASRAKLQAIAKRNRATRAPGTTESVSYVVDIPGSSARSIRQASVSMLVWEAWVPDSQKLPGHAGKRKGWPRATTSMVPRDGIPVSWQQPRCMCVAHAC